MGCKQREKRGEQEPEGALNERRKSSNCWIDSRLIRLISSTVREQAYTSIHLGTYRSECSRMDQMIGEHKRKEHWWVIVAHGRAIVVPYIYNVRWPYSSFVPPYILAFHECIISSSMVLVLENWSHLCLPTYYPPAPISPFTVSPVFTSRSTFSL